MNNDNCIYQSLRKSLELAGNLKPEVMEKKEWTAGVLWPLQFFFVPEP